MINDYYLFSAGGGVPPANFKGFKMNYQKLLIAFMWEKKKNLIKNMCLFSYMNRKIEKDILKWPYELAKKVYEKLKSNIIYAECYGLGKATCPYCIKQGEFELDCFGCFYNKINGNCNNLKSVFAKIEKRLGCYKIDCIFTVDIYKKIIEKIEARQK